MSYLNMIDKLNQHRLFINIIFDKKKKKFINETIMYLLAIKIYEKIEGQKVNEGLNCTQQYKS